MGKAKKKLLRLSVRVKSGTSGFQNTYPFKYDIEHLKMNQNILANYK